MFLPTVLDDEDSPIKDKYKDKYIRRDVNLYKYGKGNHSQYHPLLGPRDPDYIAEFNEECSKITPFYGPEAFHHEKDIEVPVFVPGKGPSDRFVPVPPVKWTCIRPVPDIHIQKLIEAPRVNLLPQDLAAHAGFREKVFSRVNYENHLVSPRGLMTPARRLENERNILRRGIGRDFVPPSNRYI